MQIQKLKRIPAYRGVSDDLRARIVRCELREGEALPTETQLAESYGVHRSTIREGLRQLEQEGLLRRAGKRLMVRLPQPDDLRGSAERALRLHQVTFRDVWEVASAIEPMCAQLAASRILPNELETLARNVEATAGVVARGESPVDLTIEFHAIIAESTRNQALQLARVPVSMLMRAGYAAIAPSLPQSGVRLLEAHRQILAALEEGDAERAVAWVRRHMMDHKRGFDVAGLDMTQPIPEFAGD
ncbi:MAG: FCD domain-containing protein [Pigmentiphaga sp.]|nr:FCD domain-containing protein [Pigmentiphaga sp.]